MSNDSPIRFCNGLYNETELIEEISSWPFEESLCPLRSLIRERLQTEIYPINLSPSTILSSTGFEPAYLTNVNLDNDPENETVALLGLNTQPVVIFDPLFSKWVIHVIQLYMPGLPIGFETSIQDVTGDGRSDFLIHSLISETEENLCFEILPKGYLHLISWTQTGYEIVKSRPFCGEEPELDSITLDDFQNYGITDPNPGWLNLEGYSYSTEYLNYYIFQLETAVRAQTRLQETRFEIQALINYLPKDDPIAKLVINRLIFLLGFSYELEGNHIEAVTTYLQLIQQAPDSPWSWLAWARLAPSEHE